MLKWRPNRNGQRSAVLLSLLLHFGVFFAVSQSLQIPAALPLSGTPMSVQFIQASVLPSVPAQRPLPAPGPEKIPVATPQHQPIAAVKAPQAASAQPTARLPEAAPSSAAVPATAAVIAATGPAEPLAVSSPDGGAGKQVQVKPITAQAAVTIMPATAEPMPLHMELAVNCPHRPAPVYPKSARRLRESGMVMLKVWLSVRGEVERSQIVQSSGYSRLDNAAIATVKHWRCNSPTRNGEPVAAVALQPFYFNLNQ